MIISKVLDIRREQPRIGGRKLYSLLGDDFRTKGIGVGRDRFFALLSEAGLLVKRRRKYVRTTHSHHRFHTYKNLLSGRSLNCAGQAYVSDITYLRTGSGFVYLFLLTDAYSRKIVGWHLSQSLGIEGGIRALKMALRDPSTPRAGLVHHSDRGIQYCSGAYTGLLKKHRVQISMTEQNHCYENSMAERVNGILKQEFLLDAEWPDYRSAKKAVSHAVKTYNEKRPHWSLGLRIPAQVHRMVG